MAVRVGDFEELLGSVICHRAAVVILSPDDFDAFQAAYKRTRSVVRYNLSTEVSKGKVLLWVGTPYASPPPDVIVNPYLPPIPYLTQEVHLEPQVNLVEAINNELMGRVTQDEGTARLVKHALEGVTKAAEERGRIMERALHEKEIQQAKANAIFAEERGRLSGISMERSLHEMAETIVGTHKLSWGEVQQARADGVLAVSHDGCGSVPVQWLKELRGEVPSRKTMESTIKEYEGQIALLQKQSTDLVKESTDLLKAVDGAAMTERGKVVAYLSQVGSKSTTPLTRWDLVAEIIERGFHISGLHPENSPSSKYFVPDEHELNKLKEEVTLLKSLAEIHARRAQEGQEKYRQIEEDRKDLFTKYESAITSEAGYKYILDELKKVLGLDPNTSPVQVLHAVEAVQNPTTSAPTALLALLGVSLAASGLASKPTSTHIKPRVSSLATPIEELGVGEEEVKGRLTS